MNYRNIKKNFGIKLAFIRNSKKLSRVELAKIANINSNYIKQIEHGNAKVTVKTAQLLANALGVEIYTLFDFKF